MLVRRNHDGQMLDGFTDTEYVVSIRYRSGFGDVVFSDYFDALRFRNYLGQHAVPCFIEKRRCDLFNDEWLDKEVIKDGE